MSWFFFAFLGHLSNGIAFIIDKILLNASFKRSATYAGLVGVLSFVVILAAPWVERWPQGIEWLIALGSGATFILALWAFFEALARAEASRVVPIIGSLIPILTLLGTYLFLGERLSGKALVGFALLILATIILSGGGKGRLSEETIWIAVLSAILFAIASVTGKAAYDHIGFLGGFLTTRIAAAFTAASLLFVIDKQAGAEFKQIIFPRTKTSKKPRNKRAALLALIGQCLGAAGFILVQLGVAKGSASIVNAMQAVQYALLVIVGIILHKRAPQLLGEELSRETTIRKSVALALTAIGMFCIV